VSHVSRGDGYIWRGTFANVARGGTWVQEVCSKAVRGYLIYTASLFLRSDPIPSVLVTVREQSFRGSLFVPQAVAVDQCPPSLL
jgi:hypothetical protein